MAPISLKIIMDDGAVTRTIKFDPATPVMAAISIIKEKINTGDDGNDYGLFLPVPDAAGADVAGCWLAAARTLDHYMLRDGDSLLYLRKYRSLRVRMLDGTVKTLLVDESKRVQELMAGVCARIGISNHEEYGLCLDVPEAEEGRPTTGTLTLKRAPRERDHSMDQLSKKLKTDDNVEWLEGTSTLREQGVAPNTTLLLKRRLFYSDRNVDARDPVQLNLLYVQTRDDILEGRHPVTEDLAALCKIRWINIRDVNRRILRKILNNPGTPCRKYKYESHLTFMRPFYKDVAIPNDLDIFNETEDQEVDTNQIPEDTAFDASETESEDRKPDISQVKQKPKRKYTKKHKHQDTNQTVEDTTQIVATPEVNSSDPIDAFLNYVGATLRSFSPHHQNLAKSKIFSVLQEHDLEQISERENGDIKSNSNIFIG